MSTYLRLFRLELKKNLRMRRQKREKIETKTELKIPMLMMKLW